MNIKIVADTNQKSLRIEKEVKNKIKTLIKTNRPEIINIIISPNQKIIPKLQFGKPIEDLSPLLNRDDFNKNMLIKIIKKDKKLIEIN